MGDITDQVDTISQKLTAAATDADAAPPAERIPEGLSTDMVGVSERLTALEDAVAKIQAQLAGPTTTKPLDFADILPPAVGGAKRRGTRRNRRNRRKTRKSN